MQAQQWVELLFFASFFSFSFAAGWYSRVRVEGERIKVKEITKEVTQCRSCNKLRHNVERWVIESEENGGGYHVPIIRGRDGARVDWHRLDVAPHVGKGGETHARYTKQVKKL